MCICRPFCAQVDSPQRPAPFHGHLEKEDDAGRMTPWILFLIFVFGPCEVLIPMLVYPAAEHSGIGIFLVALVFGIATVGDHAAGGPARLSGLFLIRFKGKEHQLHLMAGLVILAAGAGMQFLGL
jgi:nickel/cobalt exporter